MNEQDLERLEREADEEARRLMREFEKSWVEPEPQPAITIYREDVEDA